MKRYRVVVEPEAQADLDAIETHIVNEGNPEAGERFVAEIVELWRTLDLFPHRGSPRDDLREGLRSIAFRRRAVIFTWLSRTRSAYSAWPMAVAIWRR